MGKYFSLFLNRITPIGNNAVPKTQRAQGNLEDAKCAREIQDKLRVWKRSQEAYQQPLRMIKQKRRP